MESSWRMGPMTFGVNGTPATLAARYHDPSAYTYVLTNWIPVPGRAYGWLLSPGPDLRTTIQVFPIPPDHPHFPYGYDVDPDVHV